MSSLMKRVVWGTALLLAASSAVAVPVGPTGRYYVTDESGFNKVWQFQGATLSSFSTTTTGGPDGPIVVDGNTSTVRTVSGGFSGGGSGTGSEYDFNGVVQGVPNSLTLDFTAHPGFGRVVDAAFDGVNSYIVSGFGGASSGVFGYGPDFSGPGTLLFALPGAGPGVIGDPSTAQGITYDTTTNTIWTSDYDFNATATGGRVRQWSLTGTELFSFAVIDNIGNASERNTALAYDFSDDTFWMNAHVEDTLGLGFGIGELWQFDRAGNFLQKIHAKQFDSSAPANILYWGGEIRATGEAFVPEPASVWLLSAAVLAAFGAGRRRAAA